MCAFDWLNTAQPSTDDVTGHFEVHFSNDDDHLHSSPSKSESSSRMQSCETLSQPPAYENCAQAPASRGKCNFLNRIFSRNRNRDVSVKQELPSYRQAELEKAWAKVGIDINDSKQGPRPQSTPEEWLAAMDGLFGAPTMRFPLHNRPSTVHASAGPRQV